jgi:hypothetical protein
MNCGTRVRPLRRSVFACCGWLLLWGAHTHAQATLDADLGVERSDNVTRVPTDEQSETVATARIGLGYEVMRPRVEGRIGADLQYRRYLDNTYDNEVLGGANALLNWSIVPERFLWVFEDNYGQIAGNRQLPDTPDNREDFNYFSTGPDISLPLGARTLAEVSGRWSDIYYEISPEGSQSALGRLGLVRLLSTESRASLNGSVEKIKYDEAAFEDYRITEGYARYEGTSARTTLAIDAGYTRAERGDGTSSGPLARLDLSRVITSRTTFTVQAGTEFSDTAQAFRLSQGARGVGPEDQDAVAAADVFRIYYAYLGLQTERERTSFNVTLYGHEEQHETDETLDRKRVGVGFGWTRHLSPRMDLSVRGDYGNEKFDVDDFAFDEWSAGAALGWRLTNSVSLRLSVDHFDGDGDGTTRDYEENRVYFGVRYTRGRRGG